MTSLRTRLFRAIALIVVLCVGAHRRGRARADAARGRSRALRDLSHQADLIAGSQRNARSSPLTHFRQLAAVLGAAARDATLRTTRRLPERARSRAARRQGRRRLGDDQRQDAVLRRRGSSGRKPFILLRPKSVTSSRWTPYVYSLLDRGARRRRPRRAASRSCSRAGSRGRCDASLTASRSLARGRARPTRCRSRAPPSSRRSRPPSTTSPSQLARAREAERNFLLSVSHELKTPLTAIRGYAEAVAGRRGRPERGRGAIVARRPHGSSGSSATCSTSRRMNRTDFSVHPSEIDLAEVAEEAVRRYQPQADAIRRRPERRLPTARRPRSPTPTACSRSSRTSSRTRSA